MENSGPSPAEIGVDIEKVLDDPKNEINTDISSLAKNIYENPQTSAEKEKQYIEEMVAKYPPEQRKIFDNSDGIEVVYLGSDEISSQISSQVAKAKEVLRSKFGDKLGEVFKDLKVYYVRGEEQGGGWALSGANAITMNTDSAVMTIEAVEKMLGPQGAGIIETGDWAKVFQDRPDGLQTVSGEMTLIHELGHIFQAKTNTKFQDTENAPTKYGRTKEWEDYAESFMYYCYDKPLNGNRSQLIAQDILNLSTTPSQSPNAA